MGPEKHDDESDAAKRRTAPRGNGPMTSVTQRPRQFAAKRFAQIVLGTLLWLLSFGPQMKVTRHARSKPGGLLQAAKTTAGALLQAKTGRSKQRTGLPKKPLYYVDLSLSITRVITK